MDDFFNTIIIGAGISGISTAYHLINKNNYKGKVLILEGRNRIGGRINDLKIADEIVELGANWIHGIINNPVFSLAIDYKLINPFKDKPDDNIYKSNIVCGFTSDGESVPIDVIEKAYQFYFWVLKKCESFYHRMIKGDFPLDEIKGDSLGKYVYAEIKDFLCSKTDQEKRLFTAIFNQMSNREINISGSNTLDEISLKYYGLYEELPGGNLKITSGYKRILECLLSDINIFSEKNNQKQNFKLLLEHKVVKIKWNGIESKSNQPIQIICSNGSTFTCNHVVNTMPIGVLKEKIHDLYEPIVPKYKIDCINMVGFDYVNKIFLEYEKPLCPEFFDSSINEILTFWYEDDSDVSIEKKWFKKIFSFSKLNDRLLMVWIGGEEAKYAEKLDKQKLIDDLGYVLRKFLKIESFPNCSNIYQTTWGSNQFTKGAYSFIKSNTKSKDKELLSQPIYSNPANDKPELIFAGEAYHPTYFSTTHGAFLSGKKAASYLHD